MLSIAQTVHVAETTALGPVRVYGEIVAMQLGDAELALTFAHTANASWGTVTANQPLPQPHLPQPPLKRAIP
ncbi:hypothetical protein SMAC4_13175 [Sordaria macrospora]|uniref:uncharacterized protein n=1 Tax=Sordaria macrospora TaxID=5147 RepID=UPI002B2E67F2|nr:hypothetical protein SMAC4_13175 [Sordaria macrospora]